ncbi:MAG: hypothetical protein ACK559_37055, partial [bacterium]
MPLALVGEGRRVVLADPRVVALLEGLPVRGFGVGVPDGVAPVREHRAVHEGRLVGRDAQQVLQLALGQQLDRLAADPDVGGLPVRVGRGAAEGRPHQREPEGRSEEAPGP